MRFRGSPARSQAVAAVVMWSLMSTAYGQTRLCESYTPTLDGGECTAQDSVCEIKLVMENKLTMTTSNGTGLLVQDYDIKRMLNGRALTEAELKDVIVGDGWPSYRLVTVINGTMPGPCLTIFKDQTVKIHVVNNLLSGGVTIHWHGLDMFHNSYMDGVAFVTQCPILPGESFTYTLSSRQPGSYWYHSHLGAQRSNGILGPLVVLHRGVTLPRNERVMVLQDWNHDLVSDHTELGTYVLVNGQMQRRNGTESLAGNGFSPFPFHAGLINGRARYYDQTASNSVVHTKTPLEVFEVNQNQDYRFRVVGGQVLYPYRVSVQGHRIEIVASDGHNFQPVPAESFIINPGERFDFILTANQTVGNYMILAETLEVGLPVPHVAEALLHYTGAASDWKPLLNRPYLPRNGPARGCTSASICTVVNCPFSYYPVGNYAECLDLGQLKAQGSQAPNDTSSNIKEIFLNFGFPGHTQTPPSINGIKFRLPPVAAILYPPDRLPTTCQESCGKADEQCYCTHTVTLTRNKVHQLVLTVLGSGKGADHPIHIHGFSFYVVKMGYPVYDPNTGKFWKVNNDVECVDQFCNVARWKNTSWTPNTVPGLNLVSAPRKDTIIVPNGGYVIIRLRADNPGMWFVHCHIEPHNLGGMALILDGTYYENGKHGAQGNPPQGFPMCDSFPRSPGLTRITLSGGLSLLPRFHSIFWPFVALCLLTVLY